MISLYRALAKLNNGYNSITNCFTNKFFFTDDADNTTSQRVGIGAVAYIQSDNKVLLGGMSSTTGDRNLRRFNTNGTEDTGFITEDFGGANFGYVRDVQQQSDGKLIVVGHFSNLNGNNIGRICRLNVDGSIDLTYDPSTSFNFGFDGPAFAIHVLPNLDALICGQFSQHNSGNTVDHLIKLNEQGQENTAFTANWLTNGINDVIQDLAVQTDGKIVLGGDFPRSIHRINADGTEDTDFTDVIGTGFNGRVYSVDIQLDEKIIVGGWFTEFNGNPCNPGVVRLNTDGSLDTTFETEGTGLVNTNDNSVNVQYVFVQRDQKILVGGWFNEYNGERQGHIIRFNSDGTKDTSFDVGTGFNDDTDSGEGNISPDGRVQKINVDIYGNIYVVGRFTSFKRATRYNYAKLSPSGDLLDFHVPITYSQWGINDGNNDMYDGGNYINTDLTQIYDNAKEDNVDPQLSIPSTHTQAYNTDVDSFADDSSPYGYTYLPKPNDGKIMNGDSYFGSGSSYFTNMYPGMSVLVASNIHISEFSITGNIGSDGSAIDVVTIYPILSHGILYSVFFKTNYDGNGDPSINHLIIVPGQAQGITQLYDSTGSYDDHCIQNIDHVRELYYILVSKGDSDRLSDDEVRTLAQKFLDIVTEPVALCNYNICVDLNKKGYVCEANNCSCEPMKKFKNAYLPAITVCQSYNK